MALTLSGYGKGDILPALATAGLAARYGTDFNQGVYRAYSDAKNAYNVFKPAISKVGFNYSGRKRKDLDLSSASQRAMKRLRKLGGRPRKAARRGGGGAKAMSYQRDVANGYSRKRGSKRGRKRVAKYYRSVNKVIDSRLAKNCYTFTKPYYVVNGDTTPNTWTQWDSFSLFGSNISFAEEKDLYTMFLDQHNTEHSDSAIPNGDKLTIISASVEMLLKNDSTFALEVEVYQVVPKHDCGSNFSSLTTRFTSGFSKTPVTTGTAVTKAQIGAGGLRVTPFDNKDFCSDFTIINSKKYLMSSGQSINYMFNWRKPRHISYAKIDSVPCVRGLYRGFLIRIMTVGGAPEASALYTMGWKKSYSVTRMEENEPSAQAL